MNRRNLKQEDFFEENSETGEEHSSDQSIPLEKYKLLLKRLEKGETDLEEESEGDNSRISMISLIRTERENNQAQEKQRNGMKASNQHIQRKNIKEKFNGENEEEDGEEYSGKGGFDLRDFENSEGEEERQEGVQRNPMSFTKTDTMTVSNMNYTDTYVNSQRENEWNNQKREGEGAGRNSFSKGIEGDKRKPMDHENSISSIGFEEVTPSGFTKSKLSHSDDNTGLLIKKIEDLDCTDYLKKFQAKRDEMYSLLSSHSLLKGAVGHFPKVESIGEPRDLDELSLISSYPTPFEQSLIPEKKHYQQTQKTKKHEGPFRSTGFNQGKSNYSSITDEYKPKQNDEYPMGSDYRPGSSRERNSASRGYRQDFHPKSSREKNKMAPGDKMGGGALCFDVFAEFISDKETLMFLEQNFRSQRINFDLFFRIAIETFKFLASAHQSVLNVLKSDLRESLCLASNGESFFISLNALELVSRKKGLKSFLKSALQKSQKKLDDQEASFKVELNEEITNELASVNRLLIAKKEEIEKRELSVLEREKILVEKEQQLKEIVEAFAAEEFSKCEQVVKGEMSALTKRFGNVQKLVGSKLSQMESIKKTMEEMKEKKAKEEKKNNMQAKRLEKLVLEQKNKISELEKEITEQANENQKLKKQIGKNKTSEPPTTQNKGNETLSRSSGSCSGAMKVNGEKTQGVRTNEGQLGAKVKEEKVEEETRIKKERSTDRVVRKSIGTETIEVDLTPSKRKEEELICSSCQRKLEADDLSEGKSSPNQETTKLERKSSQKGLSHASNDEFFIIRAALKLIPGAFSDSSSKPDTLQMKKTLLELFPFVFGSNSGISAAESLPLAVQLLLQVVLDSVKPETTGLSGSFWRKCQKSSSGLSSVATSISSKSSKAKGNFENSRLPLMKIVSDQDVQAQITTLIRQFLKTKRLSLSLKTISEDLSELTLATPSKSQETCSVFFLLSFLCALTRSFEDWKYFLVVFKHFVKLEAAQNDNKLEGFLEETHLHLVLRNIVAFILEHATNEEEIEITLEIIIIISTVPEWTGVLVALFDLDLIQLLSLLIQAALLEDSKEKNKGKTPGKMGVIEKGLIIIQRCLSVRAQERNETNTQASRDSTKSSSKISAPLGLPEGHKKVILEAMNALKKEISKENGMREEQKNFLEMNINSILRLIK